jgi:hypothetical protein
MCRVDCETGQLSERSKVRHRRRKVQHFIWGPLPAAWIQSACRVSGKAANVAFAIWHVRGLRKSKKQLPITPGQLAKFNVTQRRTVAVLRSFERLGLIKLDCHRGRSPRVTILDVSE